MTINRQFGNWEFDQEMLTLTYPVTRNYEYEIDLEKMRCSAEILNWIFQIRGKTWATPEVMYDLLTAIRVLIHPQQNVCSWGKDRRINVAEVVREKEMAVAK